MIVALERVIVSSVNFQRTLNNVNLAEIFLGIRCGREVNARCSIYFLETYPSLFIGLLQMNGKVLDQNLYHDKKIMAAVQMIEKNGTVEVVRYNFKLIKTRLSEKSVKLKCSPPLTIHLLQMFDCDTKNDMRASYIWFRLGKFYFLS